MVGAAAPAAGGVAAPPPPAAPPVAAASGVWPPPGAFAELTSAFPPGVIPTTGSELIRDPRSGNASRETIRISRSVTEIVTVLGKRKAFRSLALGSFAASMLNTMAELACGPSGVRPRSRRLVRFSLPGSATRSPSAPLHLHPASLQGHSAPSAQPAATCGRASRARRGRLARSRVRPGLGFGQGPRRVQHRLQRAGQAGEHPRQGIGNVTDTEQHHVVFDVLKGLRQVTRRLPVFLASRCQSVFCGVRANRERDVLAVELDRWLETRRPELQGRRARRRENE